METIFGYTAAGTRLLAFDKAQTTQMKWTQNKVKLNSIKCAPISAEMNAAR